MSKTYYTKTGVALSVIDGGGQTTPRRRGHLELVTKEYVRHANVPFTGIKGFFQWRRWSNTRAKGFHVIVFGGFIEWFEEQEKVA